MQNDQISKPLSRRNLIKGACALGVVGVAGSIFDNPFAVAADEEQAEPANVQYGFWVDTQKCDKCEKCVAACRENNQTPEDAPARRKVTEYTNSNGDAVNITTSCMHCAVPSCEAVCPASAIVKQEQGIVTLDSKRCIGCKYCYQACPFGVPNYITVMDKCDCCVGNGVEVGKPPHCVQACTTGALNYGTIEELMALSSGRAEALVAPTGPSYFIS